MCVAVSFVLGVTFSSSAFAIPSTNEPPVVAAGTCGTWEKLPDWRIKEDSAKGKTSPTNTRCVFETTTGAKLFKVKF